jgi:hypothetical protein
MGRRWFVSAACVALIATGFVTVAAGGAAPAEPLRLNHIQVKGSHNSDHIEQPPEVIDF